MFTPPRADTGMTHLAADSSLVSSLFPEDFSARAAASLGIEAWRIPIVIASASGIYIAFLILVRVFGVRILGSLSSFDAVVIIMFGAVAGRVIIGHPPTVAGGAIGLATLMCLEAVFGAAQNLRGVRRTLAAPPVVVFAHGSPLYEAMHATHISEENLHSAIRAAGIAKREQVQCIILEPTGSLSVIREGQEIEPALLDGVEGAEHVVRVREGR
ncbi:DUF421 domain-containing protein [Corynebacterium auriscanis]|uniref:DUF421 domain-containing protein n=1 Tax=Corynebacterium auriscanis TaxID=99807 RepID=UPI003CF1E889